VAPFATRRLENDAKRFADQQDAVLWDEFLAPGQAVTAYRQNVARSVPPDSPLVIDLTDLAKPRAKKMKYLNLVRDGSDGTLVKGYWCIEVYALLKHKRVMPLALDVHSIDDPAVGSQNLAIQRVVAAALDIWSFTACLFRDIQRLSIWWPPVCIEPAPTSHTALPPRRCRSAGPGPRAGASPYDLDRSSGRQPGASHRRRRMVRLAACGVSV